MNDRVVGLLHPGAMGSLVGATCTSHVTWCSKDRSVETASRAAACGFSDAETMRGLVERSDVIVSVCPPGEAVAVADQVAELGYEGLYVDANAIAPATARQIAARFERFVDGGIVGPPPARPGTTRLYLSGAEAADVAALWQGSDLDARVIDGGAGAASALKMAYATWTKVSGALLLDVRALARAEGVESALLDEWSISQPGVEARSEGTAGGIAPKAWRFVGEMEQMAQSYADVGLPDGFAVGAADVCRRLSAFKDTSGADLDEVLTALLDD